MSAPISRRRLLALAGGGAASAVLPVALPGAAALPEAVVPLGRFATGGVADAGLMPGLYGRYVWDGAAYCWRAGAAHVMVDRPYADHEGVVCHDVILADPGTTVACSRPLKPYNWGAPPDDGPR